VSKHTPTAAHAELVALDQVRLTEDLTYDALAAQVGIDSGALHRILNGKSDPYDRTLHKIRQFLDGRKGAKRKKPA
jgi:transcriptional regulator with XRE-family HTH domain